MYVQLAAAYSQQYGVPIKVSHSTSRGYFLSVPSALDPLPAGFTQAVLNKRTISCSTEELTSLSDRANEAITQALTLTFELIQNLLAEVRESIDALFILTDTVVNKFEPRNKLPALIRKTFTILWFPRRQCWTCSHRLRTWWH